MTDPLFAKDELKSFSRFPLVVRKRRIESEFYNRLSLTSYNGLSAFEKYEYCSSEIKRLRGENLGCISGGCLGLILGSVASSLVGGPLGIFSFLFVSSLAAYFGNELGRTNADYVLPLVDKEQKKYQLDYQEETRRRLRVAQDEKNARLSRLNAETAEKQLLAERLNSAAAEQRTLEDKASATILQHAAEESERLYLKMLKQPGLIKDEFIAYKEYVTQEIYRSRPDELDVSQAALSHGLNSAFLSGMFGIATSGYIPAGDSKFATLVSVLERERKRMKQLAHNIGLPYIAIEHFQEASRAYFGLQRPGGNATIYDETMIQNEVIAMKESLNIRGDYVDNSLRIDRSISTTTRIESAVLEPDSMSRERIKREIVKAILSSNDEAVSRVELLSIIAAKESDIAASLEELQVTGMVKIFNRDSGEIVYGVDRLA